jgi:hypothetical protein
MTTPVHAVPTSAIQRLEARLLHWSDRLDPMLVRVVRQELRSKQFIGVFSLLLLVAVVASIVIAGSSSQSGVASANDDYAVGGTLFTVLAWIWAFVLVVVQAAGTHRLVLQERADDTWDLVELTGHPPQRLVRGMLLASIAQSSLYTAALAPFLVLAYLLRGLDLLVVGMVLVVVPLCGIAASAASLVMACTMPAKRSKAAGNAFIGVALVLGWLWLSAMGTFGMSMNIGQLPQQLLQGNPGAWFGTLVTLNLWAWWVWMSLVLSASLLTHRADDRSSRPRRWLLLMLVNAWLVFAAGAIMDGMFRLPGFSAAAALGGIGTCMAMATVVIGLFAITEDWELTPRQARAIAGSHGWRRRLSVITGPGAARGRWFTLVLATSAVIAALLCAALADRTSIERMAVVIGQMLGYGLLLLWLGDLIARTLCGSWCGTPMSRRLVVMIVATSTCLFPALLALLLTDDSAIYPLLRFLCPPWMIVWSADADRTHTEIFWSAALLLPIAATVMAVQARRMTLITRRVTADAHDRNPRAG